MIGLGKKIQEKRISSSLSIDDVKKNLRIREEYIKAIEEGNVAFFPTESYYYGYLKQYINFLKLDDSEMDFPSPIAPAVTSISKIELPLISNKLALIISLLVLITIYVVGIEYVDFSSVDPIALEMNSHKDEFIVTNIK